MTSFRKCVLAAGLAATAALLIGFQGASTVLTISEFGAKAKPGDAKPGDTKPETRVVNLQTERRPAQPQPVEAVRQQAGPEPAAAVPDHAIAAAARAKALAEIEAMEDNERAAPRDAAPARRSYRAPRTDKHKVY